MKFKKVDEIPAGRRERGENEKLMRDFMLSGYRMAELELDENQEAKVVANVLYSVVRRKALPIKVARRDGKVYLVRTDA